MREYVELLHSATDQSLAEQAAIYIQCLTAGQITADNIATIVLRLTLIQNEALNRAYLSL